jgi:adenylyltransferase/sulfurtransferase
MNLQRNSQTPTGEISPKEVKAKLDQGEKVPLLDVREPKEIAIATLENAIYIPMAQLERRVAELAPYKDQELVVYCRSGGRSANCAEFLRANGFKNVLNLTGGILAWSDTVDPSITKY